MKKCILSLTILCLISITSSFAGPKGKIICRPLGDGVSITIDGNFDDWPIDAYGAPAIQPLFPEGQDNDTTDALGEWVIYDPDRVGFFNSPRGAVSEDDPNTDFEVSTYFAYDQNYLYIISFFIDDEIQDMRDESEFGSSPATNDGIEFFFDAKNDSDDCASEISFPNFDPEEPNLDDFQIATGLNFFFDSVVPEDQGGLGAVQGIERSGDAALFGAMKFADGIYQEALAASEGPDIAARSYEDMRAAGAPNPVIADNPTISFRGYVHEMRIPFGVAEGFTPNHDMGFDLFWRDVDPDSSGNTIQFIDWAQSTEVPCANDFFSLFYTPNWGTIEFNTDNPLGGSPVKNWEIHQ